MKLDEFLCWLVIAAGFVALFYWVMMGIATRSLLPYVG